MSGTLVTQVDEHLSKVKFYKRPVVITVYGEIDESTALDFADSVDKARDTGQPIIPVVIHSEGGDVYSLLAMIEVMRRSPIPFATVVTGLAASAAAVLFTCGHRNHRYMSPHARLMIHSVSASMWGTIQASGLNAEAKEAKKLNRLLAEIMAENCGMEADYFLKLIRAKDNSDIYMDGAEALRLGISSATEIPVLVHKVSVDTFLADSKTGARLQVAPSGEAAPAAPAKRKKADSAGASSSGTKARKATKKKAKKRRLMQVTRTK